MFAPNCIDYALVFHACALSGVIVSPVAPNFQVAELKQQLQVLIFLPPPICPAAVPHTAPRQASGAKFLWTVGLVQLHPRFPPLISALFQVSELLPVACEYLCLKFLPALSHCLTLSASAPPPPRPTSSSSPPPPSPPRATRRPTLSRSTRYELPPPHSPPRKYHRRTCAACRSAPVQPGPLKACSSLTGKSVT
jgi:hypothetical protein